MPKANELELDADEIVTAAVAIFEESGLDAVSMRSVSARLGVSPVPLYSRVGNKDALVDAIADRLLADLAPPPEVGETWSEYAVRWARSLRDGVRRARDSRLVVWPGREAYVEASRPLVDGARAGTASRRDAAVQACRLLTWATVGFGAVESGVDTAVVAGGGAPDPEAIPRGSTGPRPTRCSTSTSATWCRASQETRPDDDPHPRRHREGRASSPAAARASDGRWPWASPRPEPTWWWPAASSMRARRWPRRCGRSRPTRGAWPATWATGTSARRSSSGPSRSTAASTCS